MNTGLHCIDPEPFILNSANFASGGSLNGGCATLDQWCKGSKSGPLYPFYLASLCVRTCHVARHSKRYSLVSMGLQYRMLSKRTVCLKATYSRAAVCHCLHSSVGCQAEDSGPKTPSFSGLGAPDAPDVPQIVMYRVCVDMGNPPTLPAHVLSG